MDEFPTVFGNFNNYISNNILEHTTYITYFFSLLIGELSKLRLYYNIKSFYRL